MAIQLKVMPRETESLDEEIRYECVSCGDSGFTDANRHVRVQHGGQRIVVEGLSGATS